jgi:hypothetical protein
MDHDQFFNRLMHLFLREFMELFFPDWVDRFDFDRVEWLEQEVFPDPPKGEKRVVDVLAKLPTIPADPPRPHEPRDSILLIHIEAESADRVSEFRERMYEYYHDVRAKFQLNVLPIGIFLSVGLKGRGTDTFEDRVWERTPLRFEYDYVGLPALDGEEYLHGRNLLGVAWSCVMRLARDRRPQAAAEALAIIESSNLTPEQKITLMDFIQSYSPLDEGQHRDLTQLLKNPKMERVMTFRKTWSEEARDEGRQQGLQEGLQKGRQQGLQQGKLDLIQTQLSAKFPPLSDAVRQRLRNLSPDQLDQLSVKILNANSLKELGLED